MCVYDDFLSPRKRPYTTYHHLYKVFQWEPPVNDHLPSDRDHVSGADGFIIFSLFFHLL